MRDNLGDETGCTAVGERASSLSPTEAFEVVTNKRRRQLLWYFLSQPGSVAQVDEALEHLRGQGAGPAPGNETLRTAVQHRHLPLLAEKELIDIDPRSGCVRYWGDPLVESCLELVGQWECRTE